MANLIQVPLHPDELLTSFLSRLARANGRALFQTFCLDLGMNAAALLKCEPADIARLALLSGVPVERLLAQSMTYRAGNAVKFGESHFSKATANRKQLRFCPACFDEDLRDQNRFPETQRYLRSQWVILALRTCPKHNVTIIESDPFPAKMRDELCSMLDVLEDEMDALVEQSHPRLASPLETFIGDRVAGRRNHGALLDQLTLAAVIDCSEILGVAKVFGREFNSAKLSDEDLLSASNVGFASLLEGPEGVHSLLDVVEGAKHGSTRHGGRALYGRIFLLLDDPSRSQGDYDAIKDMIRTYALAKHPLTDGSNFFGRLENSAWTTVNQIEKASGMSARIVRRTLEELGHAKKLLGPKSGRYIPRAVGDEIVRILTDVATKGEACEILGCTRAFFRLLSHLEHVAPLPTRESYSVIHSTYKPLQYYSKKALELFANRLTRTAVAEDLSHLETLSSAAKKSMMVQTELLQLLLDGRISKAGFQKGEPVLRGLRFDVEELMSFKAAPPGTIHKSELCERLSLTRSTVARLIRVGILSSFEVEHFGQTVQSYVPLAEVQAFDRQYISLKRCHAETKLGVRWLGKRIVDRNIPTAFPKEKLNNVIIDRAELGRLTAPTPSKH